LADNAESVHVLPAMMATQTHGGWTAAIALRPGLADLKELAAAGHLALPWKDHVGLGIQHTGIEGYTEQRMALSYARKLSDTWYAGIQFDMHRNQALEYETLWAVAWSASLVAPLLESLSLSAFLYNPTQSGESLALPTLARIGLRYNPSAKVSAALEAEKDWRYPLRMKAGIVYAVHPRFVLRWGVGTSPALVHAGVSWSLGRQMALGSGWRYHNRLGSSLAASLSQSYQP